MKRTAMFLCFVFVLAPAIVPGTIRPASGLGSPSLAAAPPSGVRVTFVGNAGFLIAVNGKKILIDAMFAGFPGGYALPRDIQDMLVNARPPFDDVDVVLVTHNHGDHFDAPMVRQYLKGNPKARLISTAQVAGQLSEFGSRVIPLAAVKDKTAQVAGQLSEFGSRVIPLAAVKDKPAQTSVDGIQIKALYLSHGTVPAGVEEVVNFGYLATVDGIRLFHTGDIDPRLIDLSVPVSPDKPIDLAFFSHFFINDAPYSRLLIKEWINGKYIIPIHYVYTTPELDRAKIKALYPDAILFEKEMQSWDMAK
jgi:L-ascorbate metabolism protein UlaG (beta-lactamase superfamily)